MLKVYFTFILLFILINCHSIDNSLNKNDDPSDTVENRLFNLNECDKKGLLTMINIPDTVLSDNTVQFLLENRIKGIILFNYNISSEKQLIQLTKDLKNKVDKNILIAIDHEGGEIINIPWDKTRRITARMIGRSGDLKYAYNIAYQRAILLHNLGINVILGPVADVAASKKSYLYERCFGITPEWVADFVAVTVKAQKDAGMISVLKHFPGHGKTTTNSHWKFPVINIKKERLINHELLPFILGIQAGAEMIMVGHIINNYIDKNKPASISIKYLEILKEMNFNGVIITDDLRMTGKINQTIGWGINLITGSFEEIQTKMKSINPNEEYLAQICRLIYYRDQFYYTQK